MTRSEIQKILLEAVGNPVVGPLKAASTKQAQAVWEALNPEPSEAKTKKVEKETRIVESEETR